MDALESLQVFWDKHWDHLLNTFAVLFVVCFASLLWGSVERKAEKRDGRDNEKFERIKKATIKKAEKRQEEEKQRKQTIGGPGPEGRRLFKAVSSSLVHFV